MSKRNITVTRTKAKTSVVVDKGPARNIKVNRSKPVEKARTLHFFQMTPMGALCRAYFVAMIVCQIGALVAGKAFKLWPGANVNTHVQSGKLKALGSGTYQLTAAGANYFNDDSQKPEKEHLDGMVKAIKSGERPSFWKKELSEFKVG